MELIAIKAGEIKTAKGLLGILLNVSVQALSSGKLDDDGVAVAEFFVNEFRARLGGMANAGERTVAITEVQSQEDKGETVMEHQSSDAGQTELERAIEATSKRRRQAFVSRFGAIKINPIFDTRDIDLVLSLAQEAVNNHIESDDDSEELMRESWALSNVMFATFDSVMKRFQ